MVTSRLDVHFRVDPITNTIRGRYDPGGAGDTGMVEVTLTSGLYTSLSAVCAEIQTQIQTISPEFECQEVDGAVYFGTGDNTDCQIEFGSVPLMRWLGYDSHLGATPASSYTGSVSPGTFIATLPWDSATPLGWEWSTKRFRSHNRTGGSLKLAKTALWFTTAHVLRSELPRFRVVLSYLLRGYPCRWWRNAGDASAWSWGNWDGYLDVQLAPSFRAYADRWADDQVLHHLMVDLEFVEAAS